jgi:hypothetical protein
LKRRLLLLNLVLVVLLGATGMRYWQIHRDARAREQRTLNVRIVPEKAVALPPAPAHAPVAAVSYLDVAQKMLFARDRNPNVIIDATPPPPPPVMPALPQFYGLMTGFGDPGIILSEKSGGPQKTYRVGEMVGAFKLMGFDNANIVFDWDGTKVQRPLSELVAKVTAPSGSNTPGAQAASVAPPPQVVNALPLGPGQDIGGGFRACQSNDSTPNGAVQGGMKKVEVQGMFGKSCRWEPVR